MRNWLLILGWLVFFFGLIIQASTGRVDGSVLIPLPIIFTILTFGKGREK